jgi:hypothetical protein
MTSNPRAPLCVPYFSFIISTKDFSWVLSINNGYGSSPTDGNHVIHTINWVSIDTTLSNHRNPSWMKLNKILTHVLISTLILKCGISNRFNMIIHCSLVPHSCISTVSTNEFGLTNVNR